MKNRQIYISAVLVLVAIISIAISPISPAIAQESSDGDDSNQDSEKTYEKEGKSCAEKKKDRLEGTNTSGKNA